MWNRTDFLPARVGEVEKNSRRWLLGGWPDVVDPLGREASGDLKDPEADQ
jgi:hypothetical protein